MAKKRIDSFEKTVVEVSSVANVRSISPASVIGGRLVLSDHYWDKQSYLLFETLADYLVFACSALDLPLAVITRRTASSGINFRGKSRDLQNALESHKMSFNGDTKALSAQILEMCDRAVGATPRPLRLADLLLLPEPYPLIRAINRLNVTASYCRHRGTFNGKKVKDPGMKLVLALQGCFEDDASLDVGLKS
jgi:hypothetical protein